MGKFIEMYEKKGKLFLQKICIIQYSNKREIMINKQVGHVLRTKPASEDEGGIILGTGSLDGPLLS